MTEIDLIRITYNQSENAIDFVVPATADKLIIQNDKNIIRMLRHLADCLATREYPFSNMDNDNERTRQSMLKVVREYRADEQPAAAESEGTDAQS